MPYSFGKNADDWYSRRALFRVSYLADRVGGELRIAPQIPYLDLISDNHPISWISYEHMSFEWMPPRLAIRLVNNTRDTLYVTRVTADVLTSEIDTRPIPVVYGGVPQSIIIGNEGWGPMLDTKLLVAIVNDVLCVEEPVLELHAPEIKVGKVSDAHEVVLLEEDIPEDLRTSKYVCAAGRLRFRDVAGKRYDLPFRTWVARNLEPSAGAPPTETYLLELKAGKAGYEVEVPVSRQLHPRDVDHFLLTIISDKSATFNVKMKLSDVGGNTVLEDRLKLVIFRPRYAPELELAYSLYKPISIELDKLGSMKAYIDGVGINPKDRRKLAIFVTDSWKNLPDSQQWNLHDRLTHILQIDGIREGDCCYVDSSGTCLFEMWFG